MTAVSDRRYARVGQTALAMVKAYLNMLAFAFNVVYFGNRNLVDRERMIRMYLNSLGENVQCSVAKPHKCTKGGRVRLNVSSLRTMVTLL